MHVALLQQYACSVQPETQRCTAMLGAVCRTMDLTSARKWCTSRGPQTRNKSIDKNAKTRGEFCEPLHAVDAR